MIKPYLRKTTIVLDEALYRRAKARAAEEGRSLGSVVAESISAYLAKPGALLEDFDLPVADAGPMREGLDWDKIKEMMDQEDVDHIMSVLKDAAG